MEDILAENDVYSDEGREMEEEKTVFGKRRKRIK